MISRSEPDVYKTLVDAATHWPQRLAVADEHGELTYAQLFQQTEQLKQQLLTIGIDEGSALTIVFKNSRFFIMALYAGIGCGCIVMPLAHYQKPGEIEKALVEARINYILSDDKDIVLSGGSRVEQLDSFGHALYLSKTNVTSEKISLFIPHAVVMRFTSGTTGDAKCVILSHQTVMERTAAANEGLQLSEHDNVIWVLPMAYHFVVSIMLYVRYGCGIIICDDFMAENILEKAHHHKGTFLYASPVHIRLLAISKNKIALPHLKRVVSTTTAITASICKAFENSYSVPVSQAFGIIEVGLPILNAHQSTERPEAVGFALPSFTVSILDNDMKPLPPETIGHLAIRGAGMLDGYLSPPLRRNDVLKDGWFMTGDLALMTSDGLVEIKGRIKNVINVSGNKVFPNEVEEVMNQFKGVVQSKVYSYKHQLMGEIVAADVILDKNYSFDQEELILHCRKFLSSFKIPQRIAVVDAIEMTGSGKIKR